MDAAAEPCRVSVISSSRVGPTTDSLRWLADWGVRYIDLYAFQDDDKDDLKDMCARRPQTVTDLCRHMRVDDVAARLVESLPPAMQSRVGTADSPFRALASSFPEVSDPQKDVRKRACEAVLNCARLADRLGAACVEVVGGPSVKFRVDGRRGSRRPADSSGIILGRPPRRPQPIAGKSVVTERRECLAASLGSISAEIAKEGLNVVVALEVEPGPAYLVPTPEVALAVLAMVDAESPATASRVGLNLDIGHMLLLEDRGLRPSDAFKSPDALNRVFHAHISDHSLAHFADLAVPTFHTRSAYDPWLRLYRDLAAQPEQYPMCSGAVAVEMEAAMRPEEAVMSALTVQYWLRDLDRLQTTA